MLHCYRPTEDESMVSKNKITCASEYGPVPSVFSNNGSSMNEVKYLRWSCNVREHAILRKNKCWFADLDLLKEEIFITDYNWVDIWIMPSTSGTAMSVSGLLDLSIESEICGLLSTYCWIVWAEGSTAGRHFPASVAKALPGTSSLVEENNKKSQLTKLF